MLKKTQVRLYELEKIALEKQEGLSYKLTTKAWGVWLSFRGAPGNNLKFLVPALAKKLFTFFPGIEGTLLATGAGSLSKMATDKIFKHFNQKAYDEARWSGKNIDRARLETISIASLILLVPELDSFWRNFHKFSDALSCLEKELKVATNSRRLEDIEAAALALCFLNHYQFKVRSQREEIKEKLAWIDDYLGTTGRIREKLEKDLITVFDAYHEKESFNKEAQEEINKERRLNYWNKFVRFQNWMDRKGYTIKSSEDYERLNKDWHHDEDEWRSPLREIKYPTNNAFQNWVFNNEYEITSGDDYIGAERNHREALDREAYLATYDHRMQAELPGNKEGEYRRERSPSFQNIKINNKEGEYRRERPPPLQEKKIDNEVEHRREWPPSLQEKKSDSRLQDWKFWADAEIRKKILK